MPFNAANAKAMYDRFLGPLSQPVTLVINNGTSFVEYPEITAYVTAYREKDLVSNGSLRLGDLRVIILVDNLPAGIEEMSLNDRIVIDGINYSVAHWDAFTRAMGVDGVAIEAGVRGGGVY